MPSNHFDFKVDGINELNDLLKNLPDTVSQQVQRDINMKASKIAVEEMQRNAPDGNNTKKAKSKIENNIVAKKGKGDPTSVWVGIKKKVFYAIFLAAGTKQRVTKGKGKYKKQANRGQIAANDWIGKAHEKAAPKIIDFLSTNYLKLVNNSIKKQLRRLLK